MKIIEALETLEALREWSESTARWYRYATEKLHDHEIEDLTTPILESHIVQLRKSRRHDFLRVIGIITRWAVDREMIQRDPCRGIKLHQQRKPEMQYLTTPQARQYLEAASRDKHGLLCQTALVTGLRRGELMGLQPKDWITPNITVRRCMRWSSGHWVQTEGKTVSSLRSVQVPAPYADQLTAKASENNVWLFGDENPVPQWEVQRAHRRILKAADLPLIRFHDLRHSHAVMCLEAGIDMKTLQARLGHANYAMTADRYAHVTLSMQSLASTRLEESLNVAK